MVVDASATRASNGNLPADVRLSPTSILPTATSLNVHAQATAHQRSAAGRGAKPGPPAAGMAAPILTLPQRGEGALQFDAPVGRYDWPVVRGPRLRIVAVLSVILAGSQLGHAVAYYARYGVAAGARQSAGVHAYFPTLTGSLSALVGGALMAGLVLVAAARSLRLTPPGHRRRATARFVDLLPMLFLAQLVLFMGQETIEAWVAGGHVPSAPEQLFWGALGQLPAAAIAAAVLAWLLTRLEAAWTAIVGALARLLDEPAPPLSPPAVRTAPAGWRRLSSEFPSAFRKRGPPAALLAPAGS
jgi:hypothetical protein